MQKVMCQKYEFTCAESQKEMQLFLFKLLQEFFKHILYCLSTSILDIKKLNNTPYFLERGQKP